MKFLIGFFLILTAGCSKLETAYDFAPRMSAKYLDGYFDFSSERFDQVKTALEIDFKKNKNVLKTEVLKKLDQALALADKKEVTEEQLASEFLSYRKLQVDIVEAFRPSISEVILNLKPEEIENFKNEYEKNRKKFEERFKDKEKFKEKMLEGFEKNMKTFFDDVTDEQKKLYSDFVTQNYDFYREQADFRFSTIENLLTIADKKSQMLEKALKFYGGDDSLKSPEFKLKQEQYFKKMYQVTQKIWATLTDKQRAEFKKTLNELRSEISELKTN
ncbi:MAG: DUF6279 family lipoprotein [Pseudobdellovibrio sp.]